MSANASNNGSSWSQISAGSWPSLGSGSPAKRAKPLQSPNKGVSLVGGGRYQLMDGRPRLVIGGFKKEFSSEKIKDLVRHVLMGTLRVECDGSVEEEGSPDWDLLDKTKSRDGDAVSRSDRTTWNWHVATRGQRCNHALISLCEEHATGFQHDLEMQGTDHRFHQENPEKG